MTSSLDAISTEQEAAKRNLWLHFTRMSTYADSDVPVIVQPPNDAASSSGRLTFIDNAVDQTTGTIKVKGSFANHDHRLWPGQFVNVVMTLATDAIYQAFYADYQHGKAFLHSHSYSGNALACAAALATLELLGQQDWMKQNRDLGHLMWMDLTPKGYKEVARAWLFQEIRRTREAS